MLLEVHMQCLGEISTDLSMSTVLHSKLTRECGPVVDADEDLESGTCIGHASEATIPRKGSIHIQ